LSAQGQTTEAQKGARSVWFEANGFMECPIYRRAALADDAQLDGPAVLEDRDATTLVHPGWRCYGQPGGALRLERQA